MDTVGIGLTLLGIAYGAASIPFGRRSMSLLDRVGFVRSGLENENQRLG